MFEVLTRSRFTFEFEKVRLVSSFAAGSYSFGKLSRFKMPTCYKCNVYGPEKDLLIEYKSMCRKCFNIFIRSKEYQKSLIIKKDLLSIPYFRGECDYSYWKMYYLNQPRTTYFAYMNNGESMVYVEYKRRSFEYEPDEKYIIMFEQNSFQVSYSNKYVVQRKRCFSTLQQAMIYIQAVHRILHSDCDCKSANRFIQPVVVSGGFYDQYELVPKIWSLKRLSAFVIQNFFILHPEILNLLPLSLAEYLSKQSVVFDKTDNSNRYKSRF